MWVPNDPVYEQFRALTNYITMLGPPEDIKIYEGLKTINWKEVLTFLGKTISQPSIPKPDGSPSA
jgi:hypothetical protein